MRLRRRRGVMLIQILLAIALLGAFAIVAERVFRLSLQTVSKTTLEHEELLRLEQALGALRADVWGATSVEIPQNSRLRITGGEGNAAEWSTNAEGELTRTHNQDQQRWSFLALEFASDGSWISVRRGGAEVALLAKRGAQ